MVKALQALEPLVLRAYLELQALLVLMALQALELRVLPVRMA